MPEYKLTLTIEGKDAATSALEKAQKALGALGKEFTTTETSSKGASKGIAGVIGDAIGISPAMLTAAGALGGMAVELRRVISAAAEAEVVDAKLNAVIKSTGGVAGVTKEAIDNYAKEMVRLAGVEDDVYKTAASVMLTFTKIGDNVFPDAMKAALDMTTVMGGDLQSAVVQLGKALNDPIEGVTALRRVGVSFNDAQMDVIKSLVASNDLLGAQKMILKELQTEFGGAAEAAGSTFTGQVSKLKATLGELEESLGAMLIPTLTRFVELMNEGIDTAMLLATSQDMVDAALKQHGADVLKTSASYQDYLAEMTRSYVAAGKLNDTQRDEILTALKSQEAIEGLTQKYGELDVSKMYDLWATGKVTDAEADLFFNQRQAIPVLNDFIRSNNLVAESQFDVSKYTANTTQSFKDELEAALPLDIAIQSTAKDATKLVKDGVIPLDIALQELSKTVQNDAYIQGALKKQLEGLLSLVNGSLGPAFDEYTQQHKDLAGEIEYLDNLVRQYGNLSYLTPEQQAELQTLTGKLSDAKDRMNELEKAYADAGKRMMFNMLIQAASVDGLTAQEVGSLAEIAKQWGLVDEKTAAVTKAISENINDLQTGNLDDLIAKLLEIMGLPDTKKISVEITEYYRKVQEQTRRGKGGETEYASGGEVFAGVPSLAGEYAFTRPEYFIPATNGYMLTKQDAQEALVGKAGKNSSPINQTININAPGTNPFTTRQAAKNGILDAARAAGMK